MADYSSSAKVKNKKRRRGCCGVGWVFRGWADLLINQDSDITIYKLICCIMESVISVLVGISRRSIPRDLCRDLY